MKLGKTTLLLLCLLFATTEAQQMKRPNAMPFSGEVESLIAPALAPLAKSSPNLIMAAGDPYQFNVSLALGADYLRKVQADFTEDNAGNGNPDTDPDDGGWDWVTTAFTHSASSSPTNIYGATVLGLYYAYVKNPTASIFVSLQDAANRIVADTNIRTANDIVFLLKFQDIAGVTPGVYMTAAKGIFDRRLQARGPDGTDLAAYIRDARHGQGYDNGIIPWDIGFYAVAAEMLEQRYPNNTPDYQVCAGEIAEVLYQDSYNNNPGYFKPTGGQNDGWDETYTETDYWWYALGITGLLDGFHAAGVHTDKIPGLISLLLDCQNSSGDARGAFSSCYGAHANDEDWQTTAYAVMSLAGIDRSAYQTEINHACYYLASTQDASSGAWVYSNGNHYPEVGGECTAALSCAANPMTVYVDDDYTQSSCGGHFWGYDAFATIENGVAGVAAGGTVNVSAGTYVVPSQLDLAKDVDIIGASAASVTVKPGSNTTLGGNVKSESFIYVDPSASVLLDNLTIDCAEKQVRHAVQSRGALTVESCVIQNVRYSQYYGRGIVFFGGEENYVRNTVFTGIERIGIHVRGNVMSTNPYVVIEGCTYTGYGAGDKLDYGVEFGGGGRGMVINTTITNCTAVALSDGSTSAGILITDYWGTGTEAEIYGCTITGNNTALAV